MKRFIGLRVVALILAFGSLHPVWAGEFVAGSSEAFGTFGGVEFARHSGRFFGSTALGAYDVPFEIVVPVDSLRSNGTVLFEPPHFYYGPSMRDRILGRELLFSRGFSYAAVGWGEKGLNVLDPMAGPVIIGGQPVSNPDPPNPILDEGIIVQFVQALRTDPFAHELIGEGVDVYATGVSQTSGALINLFLGPDGSNLFELSILALALWEPNFPGPNWFPRTDGTFVPPVGVGKVIIMQSEGDLLISNAEEYRRAVTEPNYRVYEVSGTPHHSLDESSGLPFTPNSLHWAPVARAVFLAGHDWIRSNVLPPPSLLMSEATGIDPTYGIETGIARDGDGNALGGVRLPEVELGQALYIASQLDFEILPGLPGLIGRQVDLTCTPPADGSGRFKDHGFNYVSLYVQRANALVSAGFLLAGDAELMKSTAAESIIGKPKSCD